MHPDLVILNARVWTADPLRPWANALAISGNHIVAIGSDEEMPDGGKRLDLGGKFVIPGLWDAHIHFYYWSLGLQQVQLATTTSLEDMLERIAEQAADQPEGAWLSGWGWNETCWSSHTEPTRLDLDRVTGANTPAIFWRADMHTAVTNSCGLRMAGLLDDPIPDVPGGVIECGPDGKPNGILRELAINLIRDHIPAPTGQHTDEAMQNGIRYLHRSGITGICDQRMKDQEDGPKALAALARLNRRDHLKLRVKCNIAAHNLPLLEALGLSSPMGDERLRLGHVKVFADGTLGSRTAWMLEPFEGKDDLGVVLTPPEQMASEFSRAVEIGFPISVHAIGDRANRCCLDILEELRWKGGEPPLIPHRIEHVQILADDDVARLSELGVCASVQPAHILDDMDTADEYLGERARLAYRFKDLLDSGTLLAFGSDAPVSDHNPFYGIHAAIFRQRPERMERDPWFGDQCLGLEEVLTAYTRGAAEAAGWDRLTGSLTPGKRADLCVLDRDLFQVVERGVQGHEVSSTQVVMTIFDGEIVYQNQLETFD